jgi:hypothetical protein
LKNSVISGIPQSFLNRKISDLKQEYFPKEFLMESLQKKNLRKINNNYADDIADRLNQADKANSELNITVNEENLIKEVKIVSDMIIENNENGIKFTLN